VRVSRSPSFASLYSQGALGAFFSLSAGDTQAALGLERQQDRNTLSSALAGYAKRLGAPEAVFDSLKKLKHPDSRAVVTGQQAGLLLGPSYTLSKAVTAINLAKNLSTPEKPVVAIFWVASQDHDTAEINHAYLLDLATALHRLEIPLPQRVAAGRIAFENVYLQAIKTELLKLSAHEPFRREVIALLEQTAAKASTFADWFAALLYALLGQQGLLVFNPLEPAGAALFRPVLKAELFEPIASVKAINEAGERLQQLGLKPQLGRAEGATNLFLEATEAGRQRRLLRYQNKIFFTDAEHHYRPEDLLARLEQDPASVSPAAGLRPITQDAILPTAITVVGPGELGYFAQLKGVYEHHGVAMPLIWPRATATVLEPPVTRIMKKFALGYDDLAGQFAKIRGQKLLELQEHGHGFAQALQELEASMATLVSQVHQIDPTLEGSIARSEGYIRRAIERLKTKSIAAIERQDTIYTRQFDRLEKQLFPLGQAQERLLSPFSFFLKFGISAVLDAFLALPPTGDHLIEF
jgi:bacillithiol biosynthesis cysteine-adding enzyme BshC